MPSFKQLGILAILLMLSLPVVTVGIFAWSAHGIATVVETSAQQAAEPNPETVAAEQQAAEAEAAEHAEASLRCEPIIASYCHRRPNNCETKEVEYLCLTDHDVTVHNYRGKLRHQRQKAAQVARDLARQHHNSESSSDWFWL